MNCLAYLLACNAPHPALQPSDPNNIYSEEMKWLQNSFSPNLPPPKVGDKDTALREWAMVPGTRSLPKKGF